MFCYQRNRDIKQVALGDTASVLNTMLYQFYSLPTSGYVTWHQIIPLFRDMYFKSTNIHWGLFQCNATSIELSSRWAGIQKRTSLMSTEMKRGKKLCIAKCLHRILLFSLHIKLEREVILSEGSNQVTRPILRKHESLDLTTSMSNSTAIFFPLW